MPVSYGNYVSAPSATSWTTLRTVPSATSWVVSSLSICNTNSTGVKVRVAVRPLGAALDTSHYLYYDLFVAPNDTFVATLGLTLIATDKLDVYTDIANVAFQAYGSDIT